MEKRRRQQREGEGREKSEFDQKVVEVPVHDDGQIELRNLVRLFSIALGIEPIRACSLDDVARFAAVARDSTLFT